MTFSITKTFRLRRPAQTTNTSNETRTERKISFGGIWKSLRKMGGRSRNGESTMEAHSVQEERYSAIPEETIDSAVEMSEEAVETPSYNQPSTCERSEVTTQDQSEPLPKANHEIPTSEEVNPSKPKVTSSSRFLTSEFLGRVLRRNSKLERIRYLYSRDSNYKVSAGGDDLSDLCSPKKESGFLYTSRSCRRSPSNCTSMTKEEDQAMRQMLSSAGFSYMNYLARGSYSEVHRIVKNRRAFAAKIIDLRKVSQEYRSKFLPRELEILKTVDHPNILRTEEIFVSRNLVCIVMEYAGFEALLTLIVRRGRLDETLSKNYFRQAVAAIDYLHSRNIAHRDVKCDNMLLTDPYTLKLGDFGFSTLTGKDYSKTFCGSDVYASPEVLYGYPYNPRCNDIYSLGIVLFIMLFGTLPFPEDSPKQSRMKMKKQIIFTEVQVSKDCKNLVSQLLEPAPMYRATLPVILAHPWMKASPKSRGNLPPTRRMIAS